MREREIELRLVANVEALGGLCLKFTSPGRRNVPDRIVLLPSGCTYFVECKAPGKKPTPAQQREHARFERRGFPVLIVDSIEEADHYFAPKRKRK